MNKLSLVNKLFLSLYFLLSMHLAQASIPVWTFTPLTPTTLTVPANGNATVSYTVTNQSSKAHFLVLLPIPGISQITVPNSCGYLGPHQSCTLQLFINGSELEGNVLGGPILCEHANPNQCYQPSAANSLHITRGPPAPIGNTTLSSSIASGSVLALSVSGRTEFGITGTPSSGVPRIITITNTGTADAVGLTVSYTDLPPGTTHTGTCDGLSTLPQGASCTIQINPSTSPSSNISGSYVACSNGTSPISSIAQVSATNANTLQSNFIVLDYGCIYQGGLVFAFDDTEGCPSICSGNVGGKALTASNLATNVIWASNGAASGTTSQRTSADVIPGIDELSTSLIGSPSYVDFTTFFGTFYTNPNPFTPTSFAMCNGNTDGFCDTSNILLFYNQFITNNTFLAGFTPPFTASPGPTTTTYAALVCDQATTSGFNDWYLPAICEMGYEVSDPSGCGTSSAPLLQNIQLSLRNLAGLSTPSGTFWSATEQQSAPQTDAWCQIFLATTGNQGPCNKIDPLNIRCVRIF